MDRRALASAALLLALLAVGVSPTPRPIRYPCRTMGARAAITLVTADSTRSDSLARAAQRSFFHVDSLMSNWTETSEVARINRELSEAPRAIDPEVASVVRLALEVGQATDGAYDITVEPLVRLWGFIGGTPHVPRKEDLDLARAQVDYRRLVLDGVPGRLTLAVRPRLEPGLERFGRSTPVTRIDLGGIAKGYAVDLAAGTLRKAGVEDALVDVTGNMFALGHPPDRNAWRVGLRDPRDRTPMLGEVLLSDRGISTSGQYEQFVAENGKQYGHILDPRSGWPVRGTLSVTVVSSSAMTSDAWDTALFVLGPHRARELAKAHDEWEAIVVTPARDGEQAPDTVWVESNARARFDLSPAARSFVVVRVY
ncbi:MAG: FAD:protein FMN transferase [Candidatus Eisenbacteria bacterium]